MGVHTYSLTLRVFNLTISLRLSTVFGFILPTLTVSIVYLLPPPFFSKEILTQLSQYILHNSFLYSFSYISTVPLHASNFTI